MRRARRRASTRAWCEPARGRHDWRERLLLAAPRGARLLPARPVRSARVRDGDASRPHAAQAAALPRILAWTSVPYRRFRDGLSLPWVKSASMNQVEQGEEVDPDQIDQVPVQGGVVDWAEVLRSELAFVGAQQEPNEDADAAEHVNTVQAGHEEVDAEEHVRVARLRRTGLILRFRANHAGFDQRFEFFFRRAFDGGCSFSSEGSALRVVLCFRSFGQLFSVLRGFRMLVLEGLELPDLFGRVECGARQQAVVE